MDIIDTAHTSEIFIKIYVFINTYIYVLIILANKKAHRKMVKDMNKNFKEKKM